MFSSLYFATGTWNIFRDYNYTDKQKCAVKNTNKITCNLNILKIVRMLSSICFTVVETKIYRTQSK